MPKNLSNPDPMVFLEKKAAKQCLKKHESRSFVDMSIEELLTAAKIEREGIVYTSIRKTGGYDETLSYGGSTLGNDEVRHVPVESVPKTNIYYEGNPSRYREVCDVLAVRLIHCSKNELTPFSTF